MKWVLETTVLLVLVIYFWLPIMIECVLGKQILFSSHFWPLLIVFFETIIQLKIVPIHVEQCGVFWVNQTFSRITIRGYWIIVGLLLVYPLCVWGEYWMPVCVCMCMCVCVCVCMCVCERERERERACVNVWVFTMALTSDAP